MISHNTKSEMTFKELRRWILNKNIRVWRRALFLLYDEEELPLMQISQALNSDPSGVERQLKKMQIDHWVKREIHKWRITETGIKKVRNDQKYGSMPIRKRGM